MKTRMAVVLLLAAFAGVAHASGVVSLAEGAKSLAGGLLPLAMAMGCLAARWRAKLA